MLRYRWWLILALWLAPWLVFAQGVQAVPPLTGHVIDRTATLATDQQQALEAKLTAFEQSTGAQIVVLLVPSTQPEDIFSYANRVASTWKIGRKEVGDGLLLLVAKDDHKLRIEVARTLEGAIPDLAAQRIIDEFITPSFKAGDFAGGIDAGVDRIMGLVKGEALPAPEPASGAGASSGFQWQDLLMFLFFGVVIVGAVARQILGNKLGSLLTGGVVGFLVWTVSTSLILAVLAGMVTLVFALVSSLGRGGRSGGFGGGMGSSGGGGWSSGGGGGGFSSGGGGSFGGGGASGGW